MSGQAEQDLLDLYARIRTIAVVGASTKKDTPAHDIPRYLQSQGYRIVPVNPREGEMFGQRVFSSLRSVDIPVDVVEVFRPPAEAETVAQDAIAIGAKVLWFQPGTHTPAAIATASRAGLTVVSERCMGVMHRELGLGPGP
jgi:predicted CoA-binding protein